jgi:hypothetical protein
MVSWSDHTNRLIIFNVEMDFSVHFKLFHFSMGRTPQRVKYVPFHFYMYSLTTLCLQNALPPLHNENDIMNLRPAEATAYLIGYGVVPVPHLIATRRRAIRLQIGCSGI